MSRSRCACGRPGPLFGGSCIGCVRTATTARGGRAPSKARFGSIRRPEVPDTFTQSYIETALWSSSDNKDDSGGDPLDQNYSASDITVDTLNAMIADCMKFQADNAPMLRRAYEEGRGRGRAHYDAASAGHDFWLTRNGHGAGFWDGDLPKDVGEALTKASKKFGEFDLDVYRGKISSPYAPATKRGHAKGTPGKSELISRKKLAEMMYPWGGDSGTGLPVYAVASYYGGGNVYPDRNMVERAIAITEANIPKANRGEHGWTKKDAVDLGTIARGLRHYLKTDY